MTIKIYLKQKGESLKTVILEDVRSNSAAPAVVYACKDVAYLRYVKPGTATVEEGSEENGKD